MNDVIESTVIHRSLSILDLTRIERESGLSADTAQFYLRRGASVTLEKVEYLTDYRAVIQFRDTTGAYLAALFGIEAPYLSVVPSKDVDIAYRETSAGVYITITVWLKRPEESSNA